MLKFFNITFYILYQSKFYFVPNMTEEKGELLKKSLTSDLNDKWRQWKYDLKTSRYDPSMTEEQMA